MALWNRALALLDRIDAPRTAHAHCDIPCGIYDPRTAQIAAQTVTTLTQKMLDLAPPGAGASQDAQDAYDNTMTRYIVVKEEHAEKVKNEVSVIVGYPQKPGHDASAAIGSATYAMYTQNDGAWVKNAAEEAQMVDAMRKGADMVIKSESGRGTKTTDTYSLKGIAQALDKVAEECK